MKVLLAALFIARRTLAALLVLVARTGVVRRGILRMLPIVGWVRDYRPAMLRGDPEAKRIQLEMEYNPHPPFDAGSPESAGPDLVAAVRKRYAPFLEARREATLRAQARVERQEC